MRSQPSMAIKSSDLSSIKVKAVSIMRQASVAIPKSQADEDDYDDNGSTVTAPPVLLSPDDE